MRNGTRMSLFLEGEIALMIEARRRVEDAAWLPSEPLENAIALMKSGPILCGESYPNECWSFCNTCALAAMALAGRHVAVLVVAQQDAARLVQILGHDVEVGREEHTVALDPVGDARSAPVDM